MAQSKKRKASKRSYAKKKVSEVVNQVREPLSLLSTLRDEGVANASALLALAGAVASGATRNLRLEAVKPQLSEMVGSLGFALRSDLEKLESRVEELETKLSEKEFETIRGHDDE